MNWKWIIAKAITFAIVVSIAAAIAVACTLPVHWLVLITGTLAYFVGIVMTRLEMANEPD